MPFERCDVPFERIWNMPENRGQFWKDMERKVLILRFLINSNFAAESGESESQSKKKTKRMRTTFTEEQVQILQANFQIDSNPDGQDLERIAQITGLSKRVTQVWFQNCRARQKKYINSGKRGSGGNAGV